MGLNSFLLELRFDWLNLCFGLAGVLLIVPSMLFYYFKMNRPARIQFSSLKNIKQTKKSLKVRLRQVPIFMRVAAIMFLLTAFSHPYLEREIKQEPGDSGNQEKTEKKKDEYKKIEVPTEGISIQLVVDRSGSMGVHPKRGGGMYNYMKFENTLLSKLDVVKIISKRFIKGTKETNKEDSYFTGRGNDLIGLYTFARYPFVACPFTLRHELLLDYISQLDIVRLRDEDGTYIGYALERAILQVIETKSRAKTEDAYNIKSSIIVLITDGEQTIRPEDSQDRHKAILPSNAAALAKDNNIKIYSIAIAPRLIYDDRGTVIRSIRNDFNIDEIQKAAESTGGKFYKAKDGHSLLNIYQEINKLEKSIIPSKKELEVRVEKTKEIKKIETEKVELFPIFLWVGLFLMVFEVFLSTIYFRRIP